MNRDKDIPYIIQYKCTCNKKYQSKPLDNQDKNILKKSESEELTRPYPKDKFPHTTKSNLAIKFFGDTYDTLFTKRNLHALSFIFERINNIDDDELKAVFRFAFISMIHLATHLPSVRENSDRV